MKVIHDFIRIDSLEELKRFCSNNNEMYVDGFINLGWGRSSKEILFDESGWYVNHNIDDTSMHYDNDKEFIDNEENIIQSMAKGNFWLWKSQFIGTDAEILIQ